MEVADSVLNNNNNNTNPRTRGRCINNVARSRRSVSASGISDFLPDRVGAKRGSVPYRNRLVEMVTRER